MIGFTSPSRLGSEVTAGILQGVKTLRLLVQLQGFLPPSMGRVLWHAEASNTAKMMISA